MAHHLCVSEWLLGGERNSKMDSLCVQKETQRKNLEGVCQGSPMMSHVFLIFTHFARKTAPTLWDAGWVSVSHLQDWPCFLSATTCGFICTTGASALRKKCIAQIKLKIFLWHKCVIQTLHSKPNLKSFLQVFTYITVMESAFFKSFF